jgi:hypothetical protein
MLSMKILHSRKLIWGIEIILCLLFSAGYVRFIAYGYRTLQNIYFFALVSAIAIFGTGAIIAFFRPSLVQELLFPFLSLLLAVVFDVILYVIKLEITYQFIFQMIVYTVYSGLLILYALYRKEKISGKATVFLMIGISVVMLFTGSLSIGYRPNRDISEIFQNIKWLFTISGLLFTVDLLALLFSCCSRSRRAEYLFAISFLTQWIYLFFCVYYLHFFSISGA